MFSEKWKDAEEGLWILSLSRSSISRQGHRAGGTCTLCSTTAVALCREQQGRGENGVADSTTHHISNRFWIYKVDKSRKSQILYLVFPPVNKFVLRSR